MDNDIKQEYAYKITRIEDEKSPFLEDVLRLWRAERKTLGFLPEGAFSDAAIKKQIVIALDWNTKGVGYLLYRKSNENIAITHLCIQKDHRGRGIPSLLFEHLKGITQEFNGVFLNCRRDYKIDGMWRKLGFIPLTEKSGRGKDPQILTTWWYDYGKPNLFSQVERKVVETKISAVIDASVFFDLYDNVQRRAEESKSLLADWLHTALVLFLTQETYNEINRCKDPKRRKRSIVCAKNHILLPLHDEDALDKAEEALLRHFPSKLTVRDKSDIRQLANAIIANTKYFITRDRKLLDKAESIGRDFAISIVRPCELILRMDQLLQESNYHPAKLAAPSLDFKRISSDEVNLLSKYFWYQPQEKKEDFEVKVHFFSSRPDICDFWIVRQYSEPIAIAIFDYSISDRIDIPVLRLRKKVVFDNLIMHFVFRAIMKAAEEKRKIIKISEPCLPVGIGKGLQKTGFISQQYCWMKFTLPMVDAKNMLSKSLRAWAVEVETDIEKQHAHSLADMLDTTSPNDHAKAFTLIERSLWPAKVIDFEIPNYIIPIRPHWAMHLFDDELASQNLFGAEPNLILSGENAYYRKKRPNVLTCPSRILWYVSEDEVFPGSKSVRACSYLDNIIIDTPKELYRHLKGFGVYDWNDVYGTAGKDLSQEIMGFTFSLTERFSKPIGWDRLQTILLEKEGKANQIQSPVAIKNGTFVYLYRLGTGKQE